MSKIEVGKTYQTRDGKTVRILATDLKDSQPVVGAILFKGGTELVSTFDADGSYYNSRNENNFDIIIQPERKSGWLNWYGTDNGIHRTRNDAELVALSGRTHVLQIITENGDPVEVKIHKVER